MDDELKSEVFLENVSDDDCGVVAFQVITGMSRKRSMRLLGDAYMRGLGMFRSKLIEALTDQGYELESKEVQPGEHTAALFASTYDHGTYLLWMESHVAVHRDGDLFNPSGWNDVISSIHHVTKKKGRGNGG